jgi:hypothetical protein
MTEKKIEYELMIYNPVGTCPHFFVRDFFLYPDDIYEFLHSAYHDGYVICSYPRDPTTPEPPWLEMIPITNASRLTLKQKYQ